MLSKRSKDFLRELHRIGAVKIDTQHGFKLALHRTNPHAPLSPFYINLRTPENKDGPLQPQHVETIAADLAAAASGQRLKYDAVAGIPRAGTPFAHALARPKEKGGIGVRYIALTKRSGSETAMQVESKYRVKSADRRERVLLIDDLITKATSKWTAIDALRSGGYEVAGIAVYLDREQGGFENLLTSGIPIVRVVKLSQMLAFYEEARLITAGDLQKIRAYLKG